MTFTVTSVARQDALKDAALKAELAELWTAVFAPMCTEAEAMERIEHRNYAYIIACRNADDRRLVGCAMAYEMAPTGTIVQSNMEYYRQYRDFLFVTQVAVHEGWRRRGACGLICAEAKRIAGPSALHGGLLRPVVLHINAPRDGELSTEGVYAKYGFHVATDVEIEATSEFDYDGVADLDEHEEMRMIWWPEPVSGTDYRPSDADALSSSEPCAQQTSACAVTCSSVGSGFTRSSAAAAPPPLLREPPAALASA